MNAEYSASRTNHYFSATAFALIEIVCLCARRISKVGSYFELAREEGIKKFWAVRVGLAIERRRPAAAELYWLTLVKLFPGFNSPAFCLGHHYYRRGLMEDSHWAYSRAMAIATCHNNMPPLFSLESLIKLYLSAGGREALVRYFESIDYRVYSWNEKIALLRFSFMIDHLELFKQTQVHLEGLARLRDENILVQIASVKEFGPGQSSFRGTVLAPSRDYIFKEPQVFEKNGDRPERRVQVPATSIAEVNDAVVAGAFTVFSQGELINYEPAAHPRNPLVAGSWQYVMAYDEPKNLALTVYQYSREEHLSEAIMLSGRCSLNYYHWLIEYLTKGYAIEAAGLSRRVPILLDASLYPAQVESFRIAMGDWPVYLFDHKTLLRVDRLLIPSVPTFVPDLFDRPYWMMSAISEAHVAWLRERVLNSLIIDGTSDEPIGRKIYLSRGAAGARKIAKESEIERMFAESGFEIVRPETLGFEAQVRLFNQCRIIAGPGGAAFSNIIFCRPGTKAVALVSAKNESFCIYPNLAEMAGVEFTYLSGANTFPRENYHTDSEFAHSSFSISKDKVARLLKLLR